MRECRIHELGFLSIAHWIPPLGTAPCETGKPRRFCVQWDWDWYWWPRPGYEKYRFWRKA